MKEKVIDPKPIKNILLKRPPIKGIFDSDWDGVPNDEDCVWYDPNRQGFHTSRMYVRSSYFPEAKKTGAARSEQIRQWRQKEKNKISRKMYGRSYFGLSTEQKRRVDSVFLMHEKGGTTFR